VRKKDRYCASHIKHRSSPLNPLRFISFSTRAFMRNQDILNQIEAVKKQFLL
jgi:hypothetical protein